MIIGVVYDPVRDELFSAEKTKGAILNGLPITVGRKRRLSEAAFGIDIYHDPRLIKRELELLDILANKVRVVRSFFSGALELCYLASGRIDIRIDDSYKPWDVAAGSLIAKESGAQLTDIYDRKWTLKSKTMLAANPILHQLVIRLLHSNSAKLK